MHPISPGFEGVIPLLWGEGRREEGMNREGVWGETEERQSLTSAARSMTPVFHF